MEIVSLTCIRISECFNAQFLQIWTKCQALMSQLGKGYIFRRMNNLNPKDVPENTIATASRILKPFNPVAIRDVSKGAATFYAWVNKVALSSLLCNC